MTTRYCLAFPTFQESSWTQWPFPIVLSQPSSSPHSSSLPSSWPLKVSDLTFAKSPVSYMSKVFLFLLFLISLISCISKVFSSSFRRRMEAPGSQLPSGSFATIASTCLLSCWAMFDQVVWRPLWGHVSARGGRRNQWDRCGQLCSL